MRKILSLVLILAGFATALSPQWVSWHSKVQEEHLLSQWKEAKRELADLDQHESAKAFSTTKKILGSLVIEKINLELPIVEGAGQENLKAAAGHITGTAALGEEGNTAIAAHRSRTFGRKFNRLNELKDGDLISVETEQKNLLFNVYKKSIVPPSDTSVLEKQGEGQTLTLITCDPVENPTSRLVIFARLVP
ncbi:class D sortase [Metabacillus sp. KIGAM252]|uniref:Class D sortase n=1 Tax=Metabacillus flavus TaxID=2823519 RepID=A0ABS5LJG7_9BACI|nr:class D sortase [Metabacillus flavus]MBS2970784.1 class D sortase [Metabacillus flavus]